MQASEQSTLRIQQAAEAKRSSEKIRSESDTKIVTIDIAGQPAQIVDVSVAVRRGRHHRPVLNRHLDLTMVLLKRIRMDRNHKRVVMNFHGQLAEIVASSAKALLSPPSHLRF